jgi:hypothetical protein
MHTDQSNKEEDIHSPYEDDVDERIRDYPFQYDGRDAARPGMRTRRTARVAHSSYWDLVNAYDVHGYNRKIHGITKRQVNRAANAVADLITSLSLGRVVGQVWRHLLDWYSCDDRPRKDLHDKPH